MAGMLPGVECARRRRFHQSGDNSPCTNTHVWSRRPSFCLYTTNHETFNHAAASSLSALQRRITNQEFEDEKLSGVAREAKKRLDKRLRTQRRSDSKHCSSPKLKAADTKSMGIGEMQREAFGVKSRCKRFSWSKMSWKAGDRDECTICLDRFKSGEIIVHLPCAHRFHNSCLVPWLQTSAHCPCCRLEINVDLS